MKCQKCGTELKGENLFCTECGHRQLPSLPKLLNVSLFIILFINLLCSSYVLPKYTMQHGYEVGTLVLLLDCASQILLFFIITCVIILPAKKMSLTICLFSLIKVLGYVCSLTITNSKYNFTLGINISYIMMIILECGMLLAIIACKKQINYPIIAILLFTIFLCIIRFASRNLWMRFFFQGYVYIFGMTTDFVIIRCIFIAVISVAGIVMGDILRRKLSYKYYIH